MAAPMSPSTVFPLQQRLQAFPALPQKGVQVRDKRGRGKAVTWPPEDQICQIRFFLASDVPSSIGSPQSVSKMNLLNSSTQNNGLGVMHAPLGIRGCLAKRARVMNDTRAIINCERPWMFPDKFLHDNEWLVADGNESREAELQKQRELRVLEAFYPRLTSIPDSPAEPVETCIALHDSLIPAIPLVPIEDECEESSKELEHGPEVSKAWAESGGHGMLFEGLMPDSPAQRTSSLIPSSELSQDILDSSVGKADPKVAAAAAAACVALHRHGATGLVDSDLLVEILKNPALLKSLALTNQSFRSPSAEPSAATQSSQNHHHIVQYDAPSKKACTVHPSKAGLLPSPVSVLSDWMQENSKSPPTMHSNVSEKINTHKSPSVDQALLLQRFASKNSHCSFPGGREDALPLELAPAPVPGLHVWSHEARMGSNTLHLPNVSAQMASVGHLHKSSGMVASFAPFPPKNGADARPSMPMGRMHPAHISSQAGSLYHQCMHSHDTKSSKGLIAEARFRGSESSTGGTKTVRLCMYYNTPKGCRNGGNCAFLHQSESPELNAIAQ